MDTIEKKEVIVEKDNSATTLLWIIVVILLVGFGVWWYMTQKEPVQAPAQQPAGLNVNVTVPSSSAPDSTTTGSTTN